MVTIPHLPEPITKYIFPIIIAVIPIGLGLTASPVFENPEMNLTVFEKIDSVSNLSHIEVILQNVGNAPSTNIFLLFDTENPYKVISIDTTDTQPELISNDEKLRIFIERLSPQSYVILEAEGSILNKEKTFWVTTDKDTKILTLPLTNENSGISSVHLTKNKDEAFLAVAGFGFLAILAFRYYHFYRSEYARRVFLGVHKIKIIRYRSHLGPGFLIIFFALGIGYYVDEFYEPEPILDYIRYQSFSLNDTISANTFLQISNESNRTIGTPGSIITAIAIFPALAYSIRDIKLPDFIWSLRPTPSQIKLNKISSSYLPAKEISINTQKDLSEIDTEIFAVKENNEIIGLISKKVATKHVDGKTTLKQVFSDSSHSTKKNKLKIDRKNFVVVSSKITLESLKNEMKSESKKYAVIVDSDKKFVGAVDYADLFQE